MTLWALVPVVALIILIVLFVSPSFLPKLEVTSPGPFDLSKESTVIPVEKAEFLVTAPEATFQAFVYFNPLMRTGTYGGCGTGPNQPSCADGTFGPCPCDAATGDCAKCAHQGYQPVFNLNGLAALEALVVPDASRQGQAMIQLIVKTETPPLTAGATLSQKYIETLALPPIPFQRWTMITVSREGRRFDVYYNDKIVLSRQTLNMPISNKINSNLRGVVSGSTSLMGVLTNATIAPKRYSVQDVESDYARLADTRGQPFIVPDPNAGPQTLAGQLVPNVSGIGIFPTINTSSFPSFSWGKGLCLSGDCLSAPTVRPSNPLYDWGSSYA